MDLKDKWALITGGTSGMGSAVALAMAEKGAVEMAEEFAKALPLGRVEERDHVRQLLSWSQD